MGGSGRPPSPPTLGAPRHAVAPLDNAIRRYARPPIQVVASLRDRDTTYAAKVA